jgi:lipoprotein-anchoring transpeptidase ErfK/SrfK
MLFVEKGSFTLTIYSKDSEGNYSDVVARYRISHGGNRTPVGTFVLGGKERWHAFAGGANGYAQYAISYNPLSNPYGWSGLLIHGPMYHSMDTNDLWPKYYDGDKGIGGENTQGCIRLVVEGVLFIYQNCPAGTRVVIVNGSPLGTSSPDVPPRNGLLHDPTDPYAAEYP